MPHGRDLIILVLALVLLPFALHALGLGTTSATEVVVFALACMALNILVGHTGLVSFGHGAWFGLGAYAAGLAQKELFPGAFVMPLVVALAVVLVLAAAFGALVLRRRGVYFSLLTLALAAMLYAVAFRWTAVTGGENGMGGITRPVLLGISFDTAEAYYMLVAAITLVAVVVLWRFHRSPLGTVLVAIRENEQRARFIGYATSRYKIAAFTLSAGLTGLAGVLLLFNNRMTSAEPISVAFSGELLAMVIIGGMRSFLGPALGPRQGVHPLPEEDRPDRRETSRDPRHLRQLLHPQDASGEGVARQASALQAALHSDIVVVAQSRRALLRRDHGKENPPWRVQGRRRTGGSH